MITPPSRLKDADLAQLLIATGQRVGSPPRGAMQRAVRRLEAAASAGLFATGASLGAAKAATHGGALLSGATGTAGNATAGLGAFTAVKSIGASLMAKCFASGLTVGLVAGGGAVGATIGGQALWRAAQPPALVSERPLESHTLSKVPAKPPDAFAGEHRSEEPTQVPTQRHPGGAGHHPNDTAAVGLANTTAKPSPNQPSGSLMSPELARELSLLDLARSALERGDGPRALHWLDQHGRQFPSGQLVPEAALLRTQAESQTARGQAANGVSTE